VKAAVLAALLFAACYRPAARNCVVTCGPAGACPDGAICSNGLCTAGDACPMHMVPRSCLACDPAASPKTRCEGNVITTCDTTAWTQTRVCSGDQAVCLEGACVACLPGSARCTDGCKQTCGVDGLWVARSCEPCASPSPQRLIAIGWSHSCALFEGGVRCWGANDQGQLGVGDNASRGLAAGELGDNLSFVLLGVRARVATLAAGGRHTCALLDTGQVKCWGDNGDGQLGLGDTNDRGDDPAEMGDALPTVDLGPGRFATAIAAGGGHTCAVLDDGNVKCWGLNNTGQLGIGDTDARGDQPCAMGESLPVVDLGGLRATSIATGGNHTCVVLEDGNVRCWGANTRGQLGVGDMLGRGGQPGPILDNVKIGSGADSPTATALASGQSFICTILVGATVSCWGENRSGQLGRGETGTSKPTPVTLKGVDTAIAIAAGVSHTCALFDGGRVKCWGLGNFGQLGLDFERLGFDSPVNWGDEPAETFDALPFIDLGSRDESGTPLLVRAIAAGGDHTCAILETGRIKCWGENAWGQLGLGEPGHRGDEANEMGDNLHEVQVPDLVAGF